MVNLKQLIWGLGFPILYNLNNLPYAITTGYIRPISTLEFILVGMLWIIPLYFLRDNKMKIKEWFRMIHEVGQNIRYLLSSWFNKWYEKWNR